MKISRIEKYFRGWYVGDFEPSAFRTEQFEVSYMKHTKGEFWAPHIHKIATEINLLLKGEMMVAGEFLKTGDIFIIEPNEVADPKFLTDCELVVIKTPSLPNDKYIIENKN